MLVLFYNLSSVQRFELVLFQTSRNIFNTYIKNQYSRSFTHYCQGERNVFIAVFLYVDRIDATDLIDKIKE